MARKTSCVTKRKKCSYCVKELNSYIMLNSCRHLFCQKCSEFLWTAKKKKVCLECGVKVVLEPQKSEDKSFLGSFLSSSNPDVSESEESDSDDEQALTQKTKREIMDVVRKRQTANRFKAALTLLQILIEESDTYQPRVEKIKYLLKLNRTAEAIKELELLLKDWEFGVCLKLYPEFANDLNKIQQVLQTSEIKSCRAFYLLFECRLKYARSFCEGNEKISMLLKLAGDVQSAYQSNKSKYIKFDFLRKSNEKNLNLLKGIQEALLETNDADQEIKHEGVIAMLSHIGGIFRHEGKYDKAMWKYTEMITMIRTVRGENTDLWNDWLAKTYHALGSVQETCGKYQDALESFRQADRYHDENDDNDEYHDENHDGNVIEPEEDIKRVEKKLKIWRKKRENCGLIPIFFVWGLVVIFYLDFTNFHLSKVFEKFLVKLNLTLEKVLISANKNDPNTNRVFWF